MPTRIFQGMMTEMGIAYSGEHIILLNVYWPICLMSPGLLVTAIKFMFELLVVEGLATNFGVSKVSKLVNIYLQMIR
jgi:hypothetical protein